MKFYMPNQNTVTVAHRNVEVSFNITPLKRSRLINEDLFNEINEYISGLDHNIQFQIFEVYKNIREIRDYSVGIAFHIQQKDTIDEVTKLYKLLDVDRLRLFAMRANIKYPPGLVRRDSEQALSLNVNENINYYKEDYDGLVVMVLALRPMIPIWGEYIEIYKSAVGNRYREYSAFQLLSNSTFYTQDFVERVRRYIGEWRATSSGMARRELSADAAVLDGISSDSLTDYLLSIVLVRRISLTPIHATSEKDSIISNLYGYLKSKMDETANNFRTKKKYDDTVDVGDKNGDGSILDKYKISTKLTHGDIQFIKSYTSDPVKVAQEVDPTVDLFILQECVDINRDINITVDKHQRLITQWTLYSVFPPQGFFELNRKEVVNLISVAQALLTHWGFNELALIISASVDNATMNAPTLTRAGITDDLLRELDEIYPYRRSVSRQSEKSNVAHEEIHKLSVELLSKTFLTNPTPTLVERMGLINIEYNCPVNIINLLAQLLIKVHQIGETT